MRVDAHHHLWHFDAAEFAWIDDSASALRRDFLVAELETVLADARIDASVVVQARQSLQETSWLLQCAERSKVIAGVVGWVPLTSAGEKVSATLEELTSHQAFVGAREILQDKPDGFLMDPALTEGIRYLTRHDLAYDLLIRCSQLPEAIRFVDLHPNQRFVLDHAGKPGVAQGELEPWASLMRDLSQRHNVFCKLSGLVTEADWRRWTEADLEPYLDTCLETFGPRRCMAGSDWPVCLVATQYQAWWQVLQRWGASLSPEEQEQVMGGTATSFYRLQPPHLQGRS